MFLKRLGLASLVIGLGIGAAGCTDGYGYSGVNVGYASGYGYDDDYYDGGFGNGYYGAGYGGLGASPFGWYGDYYYPGAGIYVYDRYRRPYRWNDGQRRYWERNRGAYRGDRNWNGFDRGVNRPDRGAYRGTWNGRDGNGVQNRGDRGQYYRGRGDRRDGVAPGQTRTFTPRVEGTPRAEGRTFTPRTEGRTFTPRTENRGFTPRAPRGDGQSRGWRGRGGNPQQ